MKLLAMAAERPGWSPAFPGSGPGHLMSPAIHRSSGISPYERGEASPDVVAAIMDRMVVSNLPERRQDLQLPLKLVG